MKIKAHCPFLGHTGYNAHARGFITALSSKIDLRVDNYTWCDDRHNYLTPHQKQIISEVTLKGAGGREGQYPPDWKDHIEDFKYDIDLVLHEHNHRVFWRDHSKPKIAYTVWETEVFSDNFFKRILEYDELWVPSKWQQQCAIEQGYPADRVRVVPEAVEADCVPDLNIKPDDSIFTFCLFGRWDRRKSTTEILKCFVELFRDNPKVQLIASVDNPFANDGLSTQQRWVEMGMGEVKNVIFKSFPSREEYIKILQTSNVFLSCARAEGWNIPLIEAMACGIPAIYSDCSGQTEFTEGKGIPIRILGKEPARAGADEVSSPFTSSLPGSFFTPDFAHLKKKMEYAMDDYSTLKNVALQESTEIRSQYSWENAAQIAHGHLKDFYTRECSDGETPTTHSLPTEPTPLSPSLSETLPKKKIFAPLIAYGGMCHVEFAMGMMATLLDVSKHKDIDVVLTPVTYESLISRARNSGAAWALSDNYTHLLFIDADIDFKSKDFFALLEADQDVAVGAYPKKYHNRTKLEFLANQSPQVFDAKDRWKGLATDFSTEFNVGSFEHAKKGEIFEVDYAATGFMLIKTEVLRTIIKERPDLKYKNEVDGYMSADPDNFYDFFGVGVNPTNQKYESEDYGFCRLWRSLGGKISVLPDINLSHIGRHAYVGNIREQAALFTPK